MKLVREHPWDVTPRQALEIQERLKTYYRQTKIDPDEIKIIAGVDAAYSKSKKKVFAAAAALSFPGLEVIEVKTASGRGDFPYIPGLLTFREGSVILKALKSLKAKPDLIFFDGHGYAHPRRFGIASHIGVLLDAPTIGVAKSVLIGKYREPGLKKGESAPLVDGAEVIGQILRTRSGVAPVFVSAGHRIRLEQAVEMTMRTAVKYRLPEPIRKAHGAATAMRS